ncbi:hypothetical protein EAI_14649 [Harpegnathos saltator]|uniref:Uncharacterized protein n=1 Tax=Harpegnathos saltator TaxID=610380 RepID=E2C1U2_HARSA|nr:hypothetical protein EAI_14649 [Harpegnathos saltator]
MIEHVPGRRRLEQHAGGCFPEVFAEVLEDDARLLSQSRPPLQRRPVCDSCAADPSSSRFGNRREAHRRSRQCREPVKQMRKRKNPPARRAGDCKLNAAGSRGTCLPCLVTSTFLTRHWLAVTVDGASQDLTVREKKLFQGLVVFPNFLLS